jgi:hypothetical protein
MATLVTVQQAADHLLLPIADVTDTTDPRVRDLSLKLDMAEAIIFNYCEYTPGVAVDPPLPPDPNLQAAILLELGELWGFRGDDKRHEGPDYHQGEVALEGQLSPTITNLLRRYRNPSLAAPAPPPTTTGTTGP